MDLIDKLIKEGWLKTPRIIEAFKKIKRVDFLPDYMKEMAGQDQALPIGYGQTNSQPAVVAFMLEKLQPKPGEKILDIGSGSGWTTALLAEIVGEKGKVFSIEVIPELKEFGENNVSSYNLKNTEHLCINGFQGYKKEAPFDRILVSASAKEILRAWKDQLKIRGKIVCPVGSSIWVLEKINKNEFFKEENPGFVFVPLVDKK